MHLGIITPKISSVVVPVIISRNIQEIFFRIPSRIQSRHTRVTPTEIGRIITVDFLNNHCGNNWRYRR